jgi:2-polyprenyl-3-methyl-5-hydroxy-6-metoxy-1,4-benzoquinol methylase
MNRLVHPQNDWNKRFSTPEYLFGEEPNAFLVAQAALLGHGRALALADGEGRNSVWLAQQGFTVDAFDFSAPAVEKAKALASKHQVSVNYACTDWQSFDWQPLHYDLVAGIFFQFATPHERAELFEKIKHSLKPGGKVVIQGYGLNQLSYKTGGPDKIDHLYDEDLLRQAFSGYEVQVCETYETTIQEGAGHSGKSALVGFVARKP